MSKVTFIEVGGFYGMTTDFVLEDHPEWKVVVFEPNPTLFAGLAEKYKDEPRVLVMKNALWSKGETKVFHVSGHTGASSLCAEKANMGKCEEIEVSCLGVTSVLSGMSRVVLNLNCEGAEIEIMDELMESGAHKKAMIFVQNHKPVMPKPELYDAMFEKMDKLGVNYLRGTYGNLHKGSATQGISMVESLTRRKKPDWAELFSE